MRCGSCGRENPADASFCASCGSPLETGCRFCGAALPDDARFCPSCGRPVEPEAAPAAVEERKLVTVLFADLVGSTPLGERLDAEAFKEVTGEYFRAMRTEVEAEGGTVEKFIGDAIVAVFGVPAAHEDDPARALRAALRMRGALEAVNRSIADRGVTLEMRMGINTGEVIAVTDPKPGEAMVSGDTVNVAARLEQSAEPGQIVVATRTARAVRGFRFGSPVEIELKGKGEPATSLPLLGLAEADERGIPGLRAPLVGRDSEIAVLDTVWNRATSERRPHLVTIYGDAGVGKSRLVGEFLVRAQGSNHVLRNLRGRCLPYGDGVTYWPLAEVLKSVAGVLDTDTQETALRRILQSASDLLGEGGDERTGVALAYTVGLEDPSADFRELPPREVRREVHQAWRSLFTALASAEPTVLVIEDIHWADPAMLDLLEDVADRVEGPLLILCPARPELTERRPSWGGGRRSFSSIALDPLQPQEADRLVGFLLDVEDLPASLHDRILERAEGNPFFLEEIVRQLIDEGRIVHTEGRWKAREDVAEVVIPDTVQGVLSARIDLLSPDQKRAVQRAAVVGRVFWAGPVGRLLNGAADRVDELLRDLEDRELVMSRIQSTLAGDREFIFKHILTRDVAYESLPRRDRGAAHATIARWLEDVVGGRRREFSELLAHHYLEA
ncbi:MAG: AAA family ATPase, partial [Actinomycetota bacterium]|nr:AAA family ATPase [Actinomycetota bacterium]